MEAGSFPLPINTRPRKPDSLVKGKAYAVSAFAQVKSLYPNKKTGEDIFKTVAVFLDSDLGITFHVYLPTDFDNKSHDELQDLNDQIKAGKNIKIVFYGKVSSWNQFDILKHGEVVNKNKLKGVRNIEMSEKGYSYTSKRPAPEDEDDTTPSKSMKTE